MDQEKKNVQLMNLIGKFKSGIVLYDYQQECIDILDSQKKGTKSLVSMATGLGKTICMTKLPRHNGKTLIIGLGKDLVVAPLRYLPDCRIGLEMGEFRAKRDFPDAEVISASVLSLVNRLEDYAPDEFRTIIIDEAHHSTAPTYRKIIDYFDPYHLIGFTATPYRTDRVRLDEIYDNIVFQRSLQWAIKNNRLSDIMHRKIAVNIDLRNVKIKKDKALEESDFAQADLARAMSKSAPVIAKLYREYAFGQTIIYVASVDLAYEVANLIPGAIAITGNMDVDKRMIIYTAFGEGKIKCLVSVDVLREGVDLPNTETILLCRPTLSTTLYTQMIGRGIRLYPGKKYLNLIEMEGIVDESISLLSAPYLFGIDLNKLPESKRRMFNGKRLSEMENLAEELFSDDPESWILNEQNMQRWADQSGYDVHAVNWIMAPDGHFELTMPKQANASSLPWGQRDYTQYRMLIPAPDPLGHVCIGITRMPLQVALDLYWELLEKDYSGHRYLWDKNEINRKWGNKPASEKQKKLIGKYLPDLEDIDSLSSYQASGIISRIYSMREKEDAFMTVPLFPIDPGKPPEHYSSIDIAIVEGKKRSIYNYVPGAQYKLNIQKDDLSRDFIEWLSDIIWKLFQDNDENIAEVIKKINRSDRIRIAKQYIQRNRNDLRYICRLNNIPVSRKEFFQWMAETADLVIPAIIQKRIIERDNPKAAVFLNYAPDITKEPLSLLKYQFPTSRQLVTEKKIRRKRLPKLAEELKREDMRAWAKKKKAKHNKRNQKSESVDKIDLE